MSDTNLLDVNLLNQISIAALDKADNVKEVKRQRSSAAKAEFIKNLASLVPDEIIYLRPKVRERIYSGVLFFADVSGFTDLCEKFSNLSKGGTSKITQVLNEYIGAMVQEIMGHNGDILKFSGDAFLAMWKSTSNNSLKDVIHAAIDCALGIQRSHGIYKTEVGLILKVKIGIAAGQIIFTVIGGSNFMVLGNTMFEVKDVGNICGPGEIIITQSVKSFIAPNHYVYAPIHGNLFSKVISIGSSWSPSQLNQYDIIDNMGELKMESEENESEDILITENENEEESGGYMLRPSLDHAVNNNLEDLLRKFIIAPIIRAIDLGEPLESLTEIRQVVIVFINIVTKVHKLKQLQDLCDRTYRNISDLVSADGGCVNKVSMFDKDLMFLCIFGLRGFKHDLETQKALYCAKKIRDKLTMVSQIISVSCGTTTGLTYCGVVGHPMRKEYTVIGRTVNKAARIMVAYPNMVSCDQQSFLASQLQSKYFTLQPYRYLKGFKNVGPIYKFDDKTTEDDIVKQREKTMIYPLLDRGKEMETIISLLSTKTDNSKIFLLSRQLETNDYDYDIFNRDYKMIFICGNPRQGKTRVLNEVIYYAQDEIPIYNCSFNALTSKKYNIFRCIFSEGCRLNNLSPTHDLYARTVNVFKVLSPFKVPEFLCALNEILSLRFEISKEYLALSEEDKLIVKKKMIKYLSKKIFRTMSLILIDNIEFMDNESWLLYNAVLTNNNVLTCATLGSNENLCKEAQMLLESDDVLTLQLNPISYWYHSALICQFLNVKGVSLELEKFMQANSNGNPGWIESFLLTLIHTDGIEIKNMTIKEAYEDGIVLPKSDLIYRSSEFKGLSYESLTYLVQEFKHSFVQLFDIDVEAWDLYQQTTKDSNYTVTDKMIRVCYLTKHFSLQHIDSVDLVSVRMLQTYDSLQVTEQQLLKCCSILGDSFERRKLEFILQNLDSRKIAYDIMKLFEIHVFACGRGYYTNGSVFVRHYLTDPNKDMSVFCECQDFPSNEILTDLPNYASCGYIRFRQPKFRQMLMNLLTEVQANMYHIRSMWYLDSKTRKCEACGSGYFVNINGQRDEQGMLKSNEPLVISKITSRKSITDKQSSIYLPNISKMGYQMEVSNSKNKDDKNAVKARTFIENDLLHCNFYHKFCNCLRVLDNMYTQMIEHSCEAGKHESLMHALLEYASFCIKLRNITVAFTLLSRASILLDETLRYVYLQPAWDVPYTRSRILCLQGQLHMEREAYRSSEYCLKAALKVINLQFPSRQAARKAKTKYLEFIQNFLIKYLSENYMETKNINICILSEHTCDILCTLYFLYRRTANYNKAYLASLWNLIEALRSNNNFYALCMAYANVIKMDMLYHRSQVVWRLENMALLMCYRKQTPLENDEFDAIIHMYTSIYLRKSYCENYFYSLKLGYLVMTLSFTKFGKNVIFAALAVLIRSLLFTKHFKKMANYLLEIWNNIDINDEDSHYAKMKLISMSIVIRVYTTWSVLPVSVIYASIKHEERTLKPRLTVTEMRLYLTLWLWYCRKSEWTKGQSIHAYVSDVSVWPYMYDPKMGYPNCTLLEGLLILIVRKIELCDLTRVKKLKKIAKELIKKLKVISNRIKGIKSRFYILEAYYLMIFRKRKKAFAKLALARDYAEEWSNVYEVEWVDHIYQQWKHWPETPMNDDWVTSAKEDNYIEDWDDLNLKIVPHYSLILPKET